MKTNLFITGASGFIGFHVAKRYLDMGFKVRGFDSMNSYYDIKLKKSRLNILKRYKNFSFIKGNLENQKMLDYAIIKFKPSIIIHLAAVSHANKSNKDPHSTFDHSLRTLENTLDFSKDKKTHVIYMSSSMVYGDFKSESVNEDETCKPIGIYGSLKYSGEIILKSYNKNKISENDLFE